MNAIRLARQPEPVSAQLKIAIFWRAVSQLESHRDLLAHLAEEYRHRILILDDSPDAVEAESELFGTAPVRVRSDRHPALRILSGWQKALDDFQPDLLLGLDEPYCLQTWRFLSWAKSRNVPFLFLSCQNVDRHLPPPFSFMEKKVLSHSDGAWFLNADAYGRATRRGFQGMGRVIPLGVNPDRFPGLSGSPGRFREIDLEKFTAGYVGRLVPEKGIEDLIEACRQANVWLTVIGDGPEKENLKELAARLGVRTEWMGPMPSTGIFYAYRRMDVMVLPSHTMPKWREQFGRVLIEAMASSVPVIGSDSGEIPRVIGKAGLIYPEGDTHALAVRLSMLKNDEGLREDLIAKGLERVRKNYTWPRIAEMLNALIQDVYYSSINT